MPKSHEQMTDRLEQFMRASTNWLVNFDVLEVDGSLTHMVGMSNLKEGSAIDELNCSRRDVYRKAKEFYAKYDYLGTDFLDFYDESDPDLNIASAVFQVRA